MHSITVKSPIASILYSEHKIDATVLNECKRITETISTLAEASGPYKFSHLTYTEVAIICWFRRTDNPGNLFSNDLTVTDTDSHDFNNAIKKTQTNINELIKLQDNFANNAGTVDALEKHTAKVIDFESGLKNKSMVETFKKIDMYSGFSIDIEVDNGDVIEIVTPAYAAMTVINSQSSQSKEYTTDINDTNTRIYMHIPIGDGKYLKLSPEEAKHLIDIKPGCTIQYELVEKSCVGKIIKINYGHYELKNEKYKL